MSNILEFKDTDALIAEYDRCVASGEFFIVYLTGGIGANGKSWCPDCDQYRPMLNSHVLEKTSHKVLKGVVDERNSWVGVSDHPYKAHKTIKAGGVPSIALHQGSQCLARAENDDEFANVDLLEHIACPE